MKNKIVTFVILLSAAFGLSSCNKEGVEVEYAASTPTQTVYGLEYGVRYRIVVIDGCEYIFGWDNGAYNGGYFLSHKGDCRNPLHQKHIQTVIDTVEYKLIRDK